MSEKFCKLFEDPEKGQILVFLSENEEGEPQLRFQVRPTGAWVAAVSMTFPDSEQGYGCDRAERALERVDLATALRAVEPIFEAMGE